VVWARLPVLCDPLRATEDPFKVTEVHAALVDQFKFVEVSTGMDVLSALKLLIVHGFKTQYFTVTVSLFVGIEPPGVFERPSKVIDAVKGVVSSAGRLAVFTENSGEEGLPPVPGPGGLE
jgi:hypothetical protein